MWNNILIVDDSAIARSFIRRILEISGFLNVKVVEAANGNQALEILKTLEIDLVLTDLNMPEMDGEELLKRVKRSPKLNHIPVIVITSLGSSARQQKLVSEHAMAVFTKPLSLPEISQFLKSHFDENAENKYGN
jgi:two-component system, chemotaxis family, chemotaxis protein CheY